MTQQTESRFAQQCFVWFNNTLPFERGRLFLIHNNPRSIVDGAQLIGMGMLPGVADMGFMIGVGRLAFLELKIPGGVQSEFQHWFEHIAEYMGFDYHLIDSFDKFQNVIKSYPRLSSPLPPMPQRKSQKRK